jgi:hypothetical protein
MIFFEKYLSQENKKDFLGVFIQENIVSLGIFHHIHHRHSLMVFESHLWKKEQPMSCIFLENSLLVAIDKCLQKLAQTTYTLPKDIVLTLPSDTIFITTLLHKEQADNTIPMSVTHMKNIEKKLSYEALQDAYSNGYWNNISSIFELEEVYTGSTSWYFEDQHTKQPLGKTYNSLQVSGTRGIWPTIYNNLLTGFLREFGWKALHVSPIFEMLPLSYMNENTILIYISDNMTEVFFMKNGHLWSREVFHVGYVDMIIEEERNEKEDMWIDGFLQTLHIFTKQYTLSNIPHHIYITGIGSTLHGIKNMIHQSIEKIHNIYDLKHLFSYNFLTADMWKHTKNMSQKILTGRDILLLGMKNKK